MENDFTCLLEVVENKFLAGVSCIDECSKVLNDYYDKFDNVQCLILSRTFHHKLNRSYPGKFSYQRRFLKHLIEALEFNHFEVEQCVYDTFFSLMSIKDDKNYYRHYRISKEKTVSVKTELAVISSGTTGLCVWEGAQVLAEFCLNNKHIFNGKRILELGCGVGLTGLTVILDCCPNEYIFSDNHVDVLDLLRDNINISLSIEDKKKLNDVEDGVLFTNRWTTVDISVLKLSWENLDKFNADDVSPDVILGADLVYDDTLFQPLCDILKLFTERNKKLETIFACTIRNADSYSDFLNYLYRNHFSVKKLKVPVQNVFYFNPDVIEIISIMYKH